MKTAFITGATGFLGRHIVDVLLEDGWQLTALVRSPAKAATLFGDRVTLVEGDLTNPNSVRTALPEGFDAVFHAAADTSTWSKEAVRQEAVNIEGTRALLQATLDKNVKRFVHVSSIAVYGVHEDVITEDSERRGATSWINYAYTKSFAERKVKEAIDRGLDGVIVNPTHIVGRYDDHNWARLILQLADGSLPAIPPGGGNFANGRHVAEGVLAAYKKGQTGHNYILGGPHASFKEFLEIVRTELGIKKLPPVMNRSFLLFYARILSFIATLTGKRPSVTREEAHMACEKMQTSCVKAEKDLGYQQVPLEQSIKECIQYLREMGSLSP